MVVIIARELINIPLIDTKNMKFFALFPTKGKKSNTRLIIFNASLDFISKIFHAWPITDLNSNNEQKYIHNRRRTKCAWNNAKKEE